MLKPDSLLLSAVRLVLIRTQSIKDVCTGLETGYL
jgi:hypothetical protein